MIDFQQLFPAMIIAKNAGLSQQEAMQVAVRSGLQGQAFNIGGGAAILLAKQEADRRVANKPTSDVEDTGNPKDPKGEDTPVITADPAEPADPRDPKGQDEPTAEPGPGDVMYMSDPLAAIRQLIAELVRLLRQQAAQDEDEDLSEKFDEAVKAIVDRIEKVIDDEDTPDEQVLDVALALAGRAGAVTNGQIVPTPKEKPKAVAGKTKTVAAKG